MGGRVRWRALAAVVVFVGMVGTVCAAPTPAAAEQGLAFETHTTYTVVPEAGVVRTRVQFTVANQTRPEPDGSYVYWPNMRLPVLAEATNLRATRADGVTLRVTKEPLGEGFAAAVVDLSPDLLPGDRQTVTLDYDLPHQPPRSPSFTRVTSAFVSFSAIAAGDPGTSSVEIRVPAALEVESSGSEMERSERDGFTVLTAVGIEDTSDFFVVVAARNDEQLLTRSLEVDDREFVVRAWPGDDAWAAFVEETLRTGAPDLEARVGLGWPLSTLTIVETATPYLYGYAGWYSRADATIEIGDAFDAQVVLHELSHVWFNDALFAERWMGEGFAEEFASQTLRELGLPAPNPEPVTPDAPGAQPLATWRSPNPSSPEVSDSESYGYKASFFVVRALADEIGTEGLRKVIAAADRKEIAYQGDPEPEHAQRVVDARRLLDLVERVGGSTRAAELFATYVLTPQHVEQLDERAAAIARYDELVAAGAGWSPPLAVRRAMDGWVFDDATERIDAALAILATRDKMLAAAGELGLDEPAQVEDAYETAADPKALAAVASDVDTLREATEHIAAAERAVDDDHGIFTTIGLWGSDPDALLAHARAAFENGNGERAIRDADRALDIVTDAAATGRQRAAIAAAVLVAGLVTVFLVVWRRRRRRAATPQETTLHEEAL